MGQRQLAFGQGKDRKTTEKKKTMKKKIRTSDSGRILNAISYGQSSGKIKL